MRDPKRGEVWWANLEPVVGHEQGGLRSVLVISVDQFNASRADLLIILPLTTQNIDLPIRSHVILQPPEGGVTRTSAIKCEDIRSVSKLRFRDNLGSVSFETMTEVEYRLRILLGL